MYFNQGDLLIAFNVKVNYHFILELRGYHKNMFPISAQKLMLWVLILRSASMRYRNKKNINTFLLKKSSLKVIY